MQILYSNLHVELLIILHHRAMVIPNISSPSTCILQASRSEFQPVLMNPIQPTNSEKAKSSYKIGTVPESVNAAYIFSRKDLSRPAIQIPCARKVVVVVRFCPIFFNLKGTNSDGLFKLPYHIVFVVATLNSLYIYDTESTSPIAVFPGLHYALILLARWLLLIGGV
ncbi:unnamed protein product [Vicia faba]|uniref:CAF1B/HIR1 beta-propeller domain-containing protein n=1 Tax=Vicia faba TaxID=3906 RepID=A0AAV0Z705_VICFA|nr:unnamed protein product [Vicia faba]